MTTALFIHVAISLIALAAGFVVVYGLLTAQRLDRWTAFFLWTTVATCLTGFILPATQILPSHIVGVICMIALTVALLARYTYRLAGRWRAIYVVTAVFALYLNMFVTIVQAFLKVPSLKALAPTQAEPPFALAQLAAFVLFVAIGIVGVIRFRVGPAGAAGSSLYGTGVPTAAAPVAQNTPSTVE